MNLFQVIVIGMLVTLFGGAGYYIVEADNAGILTNSIEGNTVKPSAEQILAVSGVYTCNSSTGCKDDYTLTLHEDGQGELSTTFGDGAETLSQKGNWSIGKRGYITLDLTGDQAGDYTSPITFLIRSIGTTTLSRIVYSKQKYEDMINPIFVKTDSSTEENP